jgi:hypothetical protein
MRGPSTALGLASAPALTTIGKLKPVVPKPNLAATFAAAVFSAALGRVGTTTLPFTKSAIPSPLVSTSIQPVRKASATKPAAFAAGAGGLWNANAHTIVSSGINLFSMVNRTATIINQQNRYYGQDEGIRIEINRQ